MGGNSTVQANDLTICHQTSGGITSSGPPDVCLTPNTSGSAVPIPYPNVAMSCDLVEGSQTVTVDGSSAAIRGSKFVKSTGDEPGVAGGVASGTFMSQAEFITYSPNVTIEGEPVCRLTDKMTMNQGNTVSIAGVQQNPLAKGQISDIPMSPPEEPKVCTFTRLEVRCGHDEREYVIDSDIKRSKRFQVITDTKPEKLGIEYTARCALHGESCAKLYIESPDGWRREFSQDKSIEFPLEKFDVGKNFEDWWELLLAILKSRGALIPHQTYKIYGMTCQGTGAADFITGDNIDVDVYPVVNWNGEFVFGYEHAEKDKKKDAHWKDSDGNVVPDGERAMNQLREQGTWKLSASINAQYGSHKFKVGDTKLATGDGAKKDSDPISRRIFSFTQGAMDMFLATVGSMKDFASTDVEIHWPKFRMGGGLELREVRTAPQIYVGGNFYLVAEPLFGAGFTIDILDWLIMMCGAGLGGKAGKALAKLLSSVKEKVAKNRTLNRYKTADDADIKKAPVNASGELGVLFTVTGDISGGLGWIIDEKRARPDPSHVGIKAEVGLTLKAYIKFEAKVFIVKAAAGASFTMGSADGKSPSRFTGSLTQDPDAYKRSNYHGELEITGILEFNGLAIYYAISAEIGLAAKEVAKEPPKPTDANAPSAEANGAEAKESKGGWAKDLIIKSAKKEGKKEGELCTLIQPHVWPKRYEKSLLKAL